MKTYKINSRVIDRTPVYKSYLKEVTQYKQLTYEEETLLINQYIDQHNEEALQQLITANLRFVVSVASQFYCPYLSIMDLIEEGNLGLIQAARHYEPRPGTRFLSYAREWIRLYILSVVSEHQRFVALPFQLSNLQPRLRRYLLDFQQEQQRMPSAAELAQDLGMPEPLAQEALLSLSEDVSLDAPMPSGSDEDGEELLMIDMLEAQEDEHLYENSLAATLDWALEQALTCRQQQVVRCLYGIGVQKMSVEMTADELGISCQRVRQLRDAALKQLRQAPYGSVLRQYL